MRGVAQRDEQIEGYAGPHSVVPSVRALVLVDGVIEGHAAPSTHTPGNIPDRPAAPVGTPTNFSTVGWTWELPSDHGTFPITHSTFRYRRIGDGDWITVPDLTATQYTTDDLTRLTEYEAQVSTVSLIGPSYWSESGKATTPDPAPEGATREQSEDIALAAGTYGGLTNDGTYAYVAENRGNLEPILRAYRMSDGQRVFSQDKAIRLAGENIEGVTILGNEIIVVHYGTPTGVSSFRPRVLTRVRLSDGLLLAQNTGSTIESGDFAGLTSRRNLIYLSDGTSTLLRPYNNQLRYQSGPAFDLGAGSWRGLAATDLILLALNFAARKVQVYDFNAESRLTLQEFDLPTGTDEYEGITTNGEKVWLLNNTQNRLEVFTLDQGSLTGVAKDDGVIEGHAGPVAVGKSLKAISQDDGQIEGHAGLPGVVEPPAVRATTQDDGQIEGRAGLPTVEVGQVRSYAHDDGQIEGHAGIPVVTGPQPVRAVTKDDGVIEGHAGPTSLILGVFAVSKDDGQIEGHTGLPTVVEPPGVRATSEDDGRIEGRAGLPTVEEPAEVRPVSKDDARIEGHTSGIVIARPIRPISKDDGTIEGHAGPAFVARAIRPVSKDDGIIEGFAGPPEIDQPVDTPPVFQTRGISVQWQIDIAIPPILVPIADGFPTPTYDARSVPEDINFDPVRRLLTGTPTALGPGSVVISAVNSFGSDEWVIDYRVTGSAPRFATQHGPVQIWSVGEPIPSFITPEATGFPDPEYSAVEEDLPDGITFDPETRTISGTPTAQGTGMIRIRATNDGGTAEWSFIYFIGVEVQPISDPEVAAFIESRSLSGKAPIYALEITHPNLTEPARIVGDRIPHVIENHTYMPVAFRASPPAIKKGEVPQASIEIDNVGRQLTHWFQVTQGGRGAKMRVMKVLRDPVTAVSSPVWQLPSLAVGVSQITMEAVKLSLVFRSGKARPGIKKRHDAKNSPGIF